MTVVKVKSENYERGTVGVENWANPKTVMLDFFDAMGGSFPVYREDLEYIRVKEI